MNIKKGKQFLEHCGRRNLEKPARNGWRKNTVILGKK
jgi:hypothetical protein